MANQNGQPDSDRATIVKGKSPRNVLISAGVVVAVIIGALGFYYQVQEGNEAEEEAKLQKKAKQAEIVDKSNNTQDLNKTIDDQMAAARRQAASEARAAAAPGAQAAASSTPALNADNFLGDQHMQQVKSQADSDAIFASPIFRAGLKVKDTGPQQANQIPGILTPA
ncbi:TrbI/VirB10 family protein, partial [Paraburkholderia fungorum]